MPAATADEGCTCTYFVTATRRMPTRRRRGDAPPWIGLDFFPARSPLPSGSDSIDLSHSRTASRYSILRRDRTEEAYGISEAERRRSRDAAGLDAYGSQRLSFVALCSTYRLVLSKGLAQIPERKGTATHRHA
jgi:hypothetical protein